MAPNKKPSRVIASKKTTTTTRSMPAQLTNEQLTVIASLNAGSLPNRVAALEIGESESKMVRLLIDEIEGRDDLQQHEKRLKSMFDAAALRAKERSGNEYRIERGSTFTADGAVMAWAAVTRVS